MKRVEHWPDIGFSVVAEAPEKEGGPYHVDWKALTLYEGTDAQGRPWRGWQRAGSHFSPNPTANIDAAEVFAEGFTKWDGCIDFSFAGENIHGCTRRDVSRIGVLLGRIHDLCGEMLPRPDFDPEELPPSAPEIVNASDDWHSIK